jgi:hypothetical protein
MGAFGAILGPLFSGIEARVTTEPSRGLPAGRSSSCLLASRSSQARVGQAA